MACISLKYFFFSDSNFSLDFLTLPKKGPLKLQQLGELYYKTDLS
jgi:hypothetical protein